MTIDKVRTLRERIARTPANGRGYRRYDQALQREVASYAAVRRTRGDSYSVIANDLGVPSSTLLKWRGKELAPTTSKKRPMGFRPVTLQASTPNHFEEAGAELSFAKALSTATGPDSRPVVVLPGGVRIEGIAIGDLAELVRSLGCLP